MMAVMEVVRKGMDPQMGMMAVEMEQVVQNKAAPLYSSYTDEENSTGTVLPTSYTRV